MRAILRIYSLIYHGVLALALFALPGLALLSGTHTWTLDLLPWKGLTMTFGLLGVSAVAIVCVVLAAKRRLPWLFFVWSLTVAVFLIRTFFFSGYAFATPSGFWDGVLLSLGALLALAGAWTGMQPETRRR